MVARRITQPGGSRVGHPYYTELHDWHFFSLLLFKPFSDLAHKNTKGTSSCSRLNYIYIYIFFVISILNGYMAHTNAWNIRCLNSKSNKGCRIYSSIKQSISNGLRLCLVHTILSIFNVMQHRLKCKKLSVDQCSTNDVSK